MPEGDSIFRAAASVRDGLVDQPIRRLVLRDRGPIDRLTGARITAVDAIGKNLVIRIEPDWGIRIHLGMRGRIRRYAPGQPWDWNPRSASMDLRTDRLEVGCFRAMKCELLRGIALSRHPALIALGPDLLGPEVDLDAVLARARRPDNARLAVSELLLDQKVAAGIGNVYKSEVLFVCRVHPMTPVDRLDDATVRQLYATARELLARNAAGTGHGRQTTREGDRRLADRRMLPDLHVYGRHHQPCLVCRTPIEVARTGDHARTTYWCPRCQPAPT